jgi:predicted anti-sigma-YlaC factor YlaD
MSLFRNIRLILSLQCREASALIAEGADRELTRSERLALRLHLAYCSSCRRFRKQLAFLRRLWTELERRLTTGEVPLEESLSESARERIQRMIDSGLAP